MNKFLKVTGLVFIAGFTAANAALTVAPIDTTDYMTVAGVVVTAVGVFFGVRKAITLLK